MKNLIFTFFAFIFFTFANAQAHKVTYNATIENNNYLVDFISDSDFSLTIIHYDNGNFTQFPENTYIKISNTDSIKLHNGDHIYFTNYKQNELFSDNFILNKGRYWVKEQIPDIKWTKKGTVAECEFMGRKYEAIYDKKTKNTQNPLKFTGLNGLITEIKSIEPQYIHLKMVDKFEISTNWKSIIQQINHLKPITTEISIFEEELKADLTKKLDYFKQVQTVNDLIKYNDFPIKLNLIEISYYDEYNKKWDIEMDRIIKMVELEREK